MNRFYPIKHLLPRKPLSFLKQQGLSLIRWLRILLGRVPTQDQTWVSYGHDHIPCPGEIVRGGTIKFQRMQEFFPNSPRKFNILYLGSSSLPKDWRQQLWLARSKKARILYNQNGVAFPAWHGPGWEKVNEPMIKLLHTADHVFYQSRFCKMSADRFLGKRIGPWEILYNAVDTSIFVPPQVDPNPKRLVLLLGGQQYQYYPLEVAFQALSTVIRKRTDVRLLVTGKLKWLLGEKQSAQIAQNLIAELNIADYVEFLGSYTQQEAPSIFGQAHMLLHTKCNDPCPSTVIEAMACGLPVVYAKSGGTPELVGPKAGIGIKTPLSWEQIFPPDPKTLAEAILTVAEHRSQYAKAARQRAVEKFDLQFWLKRHKDIFEMLLK